MSKKESALSILEWLNRAVSNNYSLNQNENSKPTVSTSNESVEIIFDSSNPVQTNIQTVQDGSSSEEILININDINFNLNTKWKIRGVISFKYEIKQYNNYNGNGQVFSFDIRDCTGEITIVSFNSSVKSIEPRIEKDVAYEITNLNVKTSDETYKTLPNKYQLITTKDTTVTEIILLNIMPTPYVFVKLENLQITSIDSIIDIQGRIVRDHGIIPGMTNDAPWTKRLIHVIDSTYQCRIILWKDHARISNRFLVGSMIKCKYLKVNLFSGTKCLSTMDNTIITINKNN